MEIQEKRQFINDYFRVINLNISEIQAFQKMTEDEIEEIKEAFNLFDTEGTGRVDPRELKAAMQSLGFD